MKNKRWDSWRLAFIQCQEYIEDLFIVLGGTAAVAIVLFLLTRVTQRSTGTDIGSTIGAAAAGVLAIGLLVLLVVVWVKEIKELRSIRKKQRDIQEEIESTWQR